jgi:hypothetical protein
MDAKEMNTRRAAAKREQERQIAAGTHAFCKVCHSLQPVENGKIDDHLDNWRFSDNGRGDCLGSREAVKRGRK